MVLIRPQIPLVPFSWILNQHSSGICDRLDNINFYSAYQPLAGFSRFINRWFKSDTVAFLSIFMVATLATFILFWLHIFLYILTIIAAESLVRVDIQTAGFANWQAFLTMFVISLVGLLIGWEARDYVPVLLKEYMPMVLPESEEHSFFVIPIIQLATLWIA